MRIHVGVISRVFIVMGFVHFLIGATLGALMVSQLAWWSVLSPYHAELNPFGWLTFIIYGMTYAVLQLFASLRVPWLWLPWAHFATAEAGIVCVVTGYLSGLSALIDLGWILQTLAGILFLVAIVSAVYASRQSRAARSEDASTVVIFLSGLRINSQDKSFRQTDRVAQRGTSFALILLVVATVVASFEGISRGGDPWQFSERIRILLYDGWVAGTVMAVSLHLFPRYSPVRPIPIKVTLSVQFLWLIGVLIAGTTSPVWWINGWGLRAIGASFAWLSCLYLLRLQSVMRVAPMFVTVAWGTAWVFALCLGISQILGSNPLSLPGIHLLFLGWITTLVYGVGYTFFPLILERGPAFVRLALPQLVLSTVGACLLIAGMVGIEMGDEAEWSAVLATGGICAVLGFFAFALQWVGKRV